MFESGNDDVRSDLLKSVLWNITVEDREVTSVQYKMPYKLLSEASQSGDFDTWLRTEF